jgi:hypothetical protein
LQDDQARRLKELEQENAKLKRLVAELSRRQAGAEGHRLGKLLSPERRRGAVSHACTELGISERRAYQLVNQTRADCFGADN